MRVQLAGGVMVGPALGASLLTIGALALRSHVRSLPHRSGWCLAMERGLPAAHVRTPSVAGRSPSSTL